MTVHDLLVLLEKYRDDQSIKFLDDSDREYRIFCVGPCVDDDLVIELTEIE